MPKFQTKSLPLLQLPSSQTTAYLLFALCILAIIFRGAIFHGHTLTSISTLIDTTGFYSELSSEAKKYDYNFLTAPDNERVWNPTQRLLHRELSQGKFPFWNPYATNGMPFLAEEQTQASNPAYLLLSLIFQPHDTLVIHVLVSFLLAGFFMFLLSRELNHKWSAATFSGIAYMLSGPLVVWYMRPNSQTYVYLPLLFLAFEKGCKDRKGLWGVVAGIAIAMMLLSGHTQMVVLALLCYELFLIHRILVSHTEKLNVRLRQWLYWNWMPGLIAFCLSAYKLIPFIELSLNAPIFETGRSGILPLTWTTFIQKCLAGNLIHEPLSVCANLLKLILPHYFGSPASGQALPNDTLYHQPFGGNFAETACYFGVIPLLFTILMLVRYGKITKQLQSYAICFIFGFLICFDFPVIGVIRALPVLNLINMNRLCFIITFSGALLAGSGFEYFLNRTQSFQRNFFLVSMTLLSGIIALLHLKIPQQSPLNQHYYYFIIPLIILTLAGTMFLLFGKKTTFQRLLPIGLIIISAVDSLQFSNNFLTFQPPSLVNPLTSRSQFLSSFANPLYRMKYIGAFQPSFNFAFEGLMMDATFSVLQIKWQNELINAIARKWQAKIQPHQGTVNALNSKWLDVNSVALLGIDQYLGDDMIRAQNNPALMPVYLDTDIALMRNTEAIPRFSLHSRYILEDDVEKIVAAMDSDTFDYRNAVFISPATKPQLAYDTPAALMTGTPPHIDVKKVDFDEIALEVETEHPGLLTISDTWYPGWRVAVDGKDQHILRANYAFRAIEIHQGVHTVTMRYRPTSLMLGLIITTVSIVLLAWWGAYQLIQINRKMAHE